MKYFLAFCLTLISIFAFSQVVVDTAWTKIIGGSLDESPGYGIEMRSNIDVNDNGEVFLFFSTESSDYFMSNNYGERDLFLSKLSSTGDTVWTRIIGGSDWDLALDVLATEDGGCFIAGYTYSKDYDMDSHNDSGSGYDAFVAKYDANGNKIWLQTYGGTEFLGITSSDKINSISLLSNGNILAVGQTNSQNGDLASQFNLETFYVGMVMEINSLNGDIENIKKLWWTNHDEYNSNHILKGFELEDESGFMFFGESLYAPFATDKLWLIKTDLDFNIEWQKEFGSTSYNIGYCAALKNNVLTVSAAARSIDGDFVGAGVIFGDTDVWVGSIDMEGNIIKQNIIGGSAGEMIFDMIPTYQGYILAGFTNSTDFYGSGDISTVSDFWLLHIDDNLDTISTPYKNGGTDSDALTGVAYANGKLVVTGRTSSTDSLIYHNYGGRDIWVAEFTGLVSEIENADYSAKFTIHPNPIKKGEEIFAKISSENNLLTQIQIYNIQGKIVFSETIPLTIGENTYQISTNGFNNGLYLMHMKQNGYTSTKRFIIVE